MKSRRHVCLLALVLPLLSGCLGATIAAQVAPTVLGLTSMANAEDRSPFAIQKVNSQLSGEDDLAKLDVQIRLAECGNPPSQYWLASALQNGFNTTPNSVEIYKWYLLAELGSYAPAGEELSALDATMSAPDIAEARARAGAWQASTEGCEAVEPEPEQQPVENA